MTHHHSEMLRRRGFKEGSGRAAGASFQFRDLPQSSQRNAAEHAETDRILASREDLDTSKPCLLLGLLQQFEEVVAHQNLVDFEEFDQGADCRFGAPDRG